MKSDGPDEIGARYLKLTAEFPAVSLFNLFGFANEPLLWRASRFGGELQSQIQCLRRLHEQWQALRPELKDLFADQVETRWQELRVLLEDSSEGEEDQFNPRRDADHFFDGGVPAVDSPEINHVGRAAPGSRSLIGSRLSGMVKYVPYDGRYAFIDAGNAGDFMFRPSELQSEFRWEDVQQGVELEFEVVAMRWTRPSDGKPMAGRARNVCLNLREDESADTQ